MLWCRLAFFAAATMLVSAAHAQTTITFRFNDPEALQMRQALDEFEKANPDIKVTLQRVSWSEAQQQYLREAAVGSAPDVAQFAFGWPRPFSAAGALRPLDDLIAKTGIGSPDGISSSRRTWHTGRTARSTGSLSRPTRGRCSTTRTS
jgi:multiple sugar transport system substrate-binding protein